jgi:endoglucanase
MAFALIASVSRVILVAAALITEALAQTAVAKHGKLSVSGNRIIDQHGEPVQLRGMSIFWSQWSPGSKYYNRDAVKHLVDDWHVTVVRAAMGIEPDGYLADPAREKARIIAVVDAAIEFGIYVIIDWHDHYADQHILQSKEFFREMAQKYGGLPNIIFETFNEPIHQDWNSVIKPYHEQLVPEIRKYSNNIIVLGTKMYSQDVDEASWNKVPGANLAYTLHFYANTHKGSLRNKATTAMNNGIAIFVTEWGTCSADGNGQLDLNEAQVWLDFLKQHSISDANWAIADKSEACAALKPGAGANGGWAASDLTTSGTWVRNSIRTFSPATCSKVNTNRYHPDLGGCCSGLVECKEARSTSDSVYCPVESAGHGSTCWSKIDMCRTSCGSTSGSCEAALNNNAGGYTCGARIAWLQSNRGMNDIQAKNHVAGEFPSECGACGVTPPTPSISCNDKHKYCGYWSQSGFCRGTYQAYMQSNCPRTCGYCANAIGFAFSATDYNQTTNQTGTFDQMVVPVEPNSTSLWNGLDLEHSGAGVVAMSACSERFPWVFLPLMAVLALCRLD